MFDFYYRCYFLYDQSFAYGWWQMFGLETRRRVLVPYHHLKNIMMHRKRNRIDNKTLTQVLCWSELRDILPEQSRTSKHSLVSTSSPMHSFISFSVLDIIFLTRVEFWSPQVSEQELHVDQSPFLHNSITIEILEMELNDKTVFKCSRKSC